MLLAHTDSMKGCIMTIPQKRAACFEQVHPLHYIPLPAPPPQVWIQKPVFRPALSPVAPHFHALVRMCMAPYLQWH
jgi:hypothetical protein